jgi:ubiquinone/menaquinone biosynthesis C-methylase UbiE
MVSSLDHVLDPLLALKEARRVLRKDGRVHVWTHLHPTHSRRFRALASACARRLLQPHRWLTIHESLLRQGACCDVLRRNQTSTTSGF